jgi:hypothetical protein
MATGSGTGTPATGVTTYASVAQLRDYLPQVPSGASYDADLTDVLERATAAIDLELGFSFGGYATAAARSFFASGGRVLHLPYYQSGTLTAISLTYEESDRPEAANTATQTLPTATAFTDYYAEWDDHTYLWRPTGWPRGRYSATAAWGYGDAPDSVVQICLEVARDLWQAKDGNMASLTVGVDGPGVRTVQYAWTHRQYTALRHIRYAYGEVGFA